MKSTLLAAAIVVSAFVFMLIGCEKKNLKKDGSASCIDLKINAIKNEPVRNPPAEVWRWEVDNQTFLYITADCCDQFNKLYDTHCNYVCAPDGGFTGTGDGNCPAFSDGVKRTLVWKDTRK